MKNPACIGAELAPFGVDLTPFSSEARAILDRCLAITSGLTGAESPEAVSAMYIELREMLISLPAAGGTSREQVDRAATAAYLQGLAVGLTVLARCLPAVEEATRA